MSKFPIYFLYPGDGYNNWKFIVQVNETTFIGTTRVYANGQMLDPVTTCWNHADPAWREISKETAVEDYDQGWVFERSSGYVGWRNIYTGRWKYASEMA